MALLERLFGARSRRQEMAPLYRAIVAEARDPGWFTTGQAPDTPDGRFDMLAAVLSLALLRLESDGARYAAESALLAELFIDDMDGQLRQSGIGDVVVGKHIGRMMGALGGRLTAYREALDEEGGFEEALERNLYRGDPPGRNAIGYVETRLRALAEALDAIEGEALVAGRWPRR